MRINGSLAKGLIAALVLTLVPLVAFSAQKVTPGSTCKVLNQKVVYQNKTYTCVMSGKKLVWNKGAVVKKPTPTPSPAPTVTVTATPSPAPTVTVTATPSPAPTVTVTATPSPAPTVTVTATPSPAPTVTVTATPSPAPTPVLKSVLEIQLSAAYKAELERDIPFTLVVENPNLSSKNKFLIEEFRKHLKWLAGIGAQITNPLVLIYADTEDWMNEEFKRQGCVFAPGHRLPLGGYAILADCGKKFLITRPNADREDPASSIETQNGLIHEAFHQWQNQVMPAGLSGYPKWFIEGGAHAIARYAFWTQNSLKVSPEKFLTEWFTPKHEFRRICVGVNVREMIPNIPYPEKGWVCAYSKGQVAIDLIIEKYGVESFFALYRTPKSVGTEDFPKIFRKVTGQEIEAFYNEVDQEMKIRGWD